MKLKLSPGVLLLFLALLLEHSPLLPAALLAAALHELGHLAAAYLLHIPMECMTLGLFGVKLTPKKTLPSYPKEAILAAGGPLVSLLLGVLTLGAKGGFWGIFSTLNFSFGVLNLFPIRDFDGGRILSSLLLLFFPPQRVEKVLFFTTYFSLFFFFALSSCMLLRYGEHPALSALSAALFVRLFLTATEKGGTP